MDDQTTSRLANQSSGLLQEEILGNIIFVYDTGK